MYRINKKEINIADLQNTLPKISKGVEKYTYIMDRIHKCNVTQDQDFQKVYKDFYRMGLRRWSEETSKNYFKYMEDRKSDSDTLTFREILIYFHNLTSSFEPSFSSKLLASINPNMPVWDEEVLRELKVKAPSSTSPNRLEKTIELYNAICLWYDEYLKTTNAKDVIQEVEKAFPKLDATNIKKIDLALWSMKEIRKKQKN